MTKRLTISNRNSLKKAQIDSKVLIKNFGKRLSAVEVYLGKRATRESRSRNKARMHFTEENADDIIRKVGCTAVMRCKSGAA